MTRSRCHNGVDGERADRVGQGHIAGDAHLGQGYSMRGKPRWAMGRTGRAHVHFAGACHPASVGPAAIEADARPGKATACSPQDRTGWHRLSSSSLPIHAATSGNAYQIRGDPHRCLGGAQVDQPIGRQLAADRSQHARLGRRIEVN